MRTLYVCYFGLREPLVQTQVLPYLRKLAVADVKVHLLTFEPRLHEHSNGGALQRHQERLLREGIRWSYLPYHKSPSLPATLYDIMAGARFAVQLARREGVDVLHARAHVSMAMALCAQRFARVKLVFDIRGLMAEEYADAGIWTERSLPFRFVKMLERVGIRHADQIVVLTERLRDWLIAQKLKSSDKIAVIPCCVDLARFDDVDIQAQRSSEDSASGRFEVVYAGSLGGLYLVEEMGRFFKAIKERRPDAFLRILSISPPAQGATALRCAGLDENDFEIGPVPTADVPVHLRRARLGVSFRKPSFAQIGASPTKIPEYLAIGIPVVCNEGIGDTDKLLEGERVGVIVREFDAAAYQAAAEQALTLVNEFAIKERCRRVAYEHFDLHKIGGPQYVNLYRRLEEMQPLRLNGKESS